MKKVLFFFILFPVCFLAQGSYKYLVVTRDKIYVNHGKRNVGLTSEGSSSLNLDIYSHSNKKIYSKNFYTQVLGIYREYYSENLYPTRRRSEILEISSDQYPIRVEYSTNKRYLGNDCSGNSTKIIKLEDATQNIFFDVTEGEDICEIPPAIGDLNYFSDTVFGYSLSSKDYPKCGSFEWENNVNYLVDYYEYSFDKINFYKLPIRSDSRVYFEDLVGLSSNLPQTIFVRGIYKNSSNYLYSSNFGFPLYTNVAVYTFYRCPPKLISSIGVDTNCSSISDGLIRFKFDNDLEPDEILHLLLKDANTSGVFGQKDVSSTEFNNNRGNLVWNGLPKGNYILEYQTIKSGSQPSSLVISPKIQIDSPSKLTFTTTSTPILCYGDNSGSITINAIGGKGNYQYSKDGGNSWQPSNVFNGLRSGNYSVQVKDSNGCLAPDGAQDVLINQPNGLLGIELVKTISPSTDVSTDGQIDVRIIGGVAPYTYFWQSTTNNLNGQINNEDISSLSGDATYTLIVRDKNNCTASFTQTLEAPEPIVIKFDNPLIKCHGGTVRLTATVSGGNLPYKNLEWIPNNYLPINTANTSSINNLSAGDYLFRVVDQRDVIRTALYKVDTAPSKLNITGLNTTIIRGISTVYQKCSSDTNTRIDVTIQGGVAPYNYVWTNKDNPSIVLSTTEDLIAPTPGSYQLNVTDANSCTTTQLFNVVGATPLDFTPLIETAILDPGTATGAIRINANGGTGDYTYSKEGVNWQPSNIFTNLKAGNYDFYIKDTNGCIIGPKRITLTEPPVFQITIQKIEGIKCFGETTGSLKAIAIGGTPNATAPFYNYSWTHTTTGTVYTGETLSDLPAGTYTILVTDKNNVTRSAQYELLSPSVLNFTTTTKQLSCFGANDGQISLDVLGGTPPYTYYINDTIYPNAIISGLSPGNYTPKVKDANNCISEKAVIILTQPDPLKATEKILPVSTLTTADGAIQVTVSGGTPPYNYSWTPDLGNTNNPRNLLKGEYKLRLTDGKGCHLDKVYNVGLIEPLNLHLDGTNSHLDLNCFGESTGKISILISGGRPGPIEAPYTIRWYDAKNQQIGDKETISNLPAGNYSVTITDFNTPKGEIKKIVTITQPFAALDLQLTQTKAVICNQQKTAELQATVQGGTPPYTYQWKNSSNKLIATTKLLSNIGAGSYTLFVEDAKGCKTNQNSIITEPAVLQGVLKSTMGTIYGQPTGTIELQEILGGTKPYRYKMNAGSWQTTTKFEKLKAGNYTITVEDANGCSLDLKTKITEPEELITRILNTNQGIIQCHGDQPVNLESITTGGIQPYFFQWKKNGIIIPNAQLNKLNSVGAGTYEVQIVDNAGAQSSALITIKEPETLRAIYTKVDASCEAPIGGKIILEVSGGTAPYTYLWSNGFKGTNSLATDSYHELKNIGIGNYSVQVTDANHCVLVDPKLTNINIKTTGGLQLNEKVTNVSCGQTNNGSILLNPSGGTGKYHVEWDNPSWQGLELTNLEAGTYKGTLTDLGSDCKLPFTLTLQGSIPLVVNLGEDIVLCKGQSHTIDAEIKLQGLDYLWTSEKGFSSTNPKVTFTQSGTYTLQVKNGHCVYSDQIVVNVLDQAIEANFMIATQTYRDQEIVLVNISNNSTPNTYEWILPDSAEIIAQNKDNIIVKFKQNGKYQVGIKSKTTSGCQEEQLKEIIVEENTKNTTTHASNLLIKNYKIYPNPLESDDKEMNVEVELAFDSPITLSVYRMELGALILELEKPASKNHVEKIPFQHAAGVYYVIMKTNGAVQAKKVIRK
ncbi:hypothetical protein BWK63_06570 [Flavobacterium covae]|uniref:SprB repeat-containing protein n=1 Tax=Flavobacterium covae TaxID=2906076 RepID=A0ABW8PJ90_9FLAO|nr:MULTISPECIES: SprB repeat-containing protein [Flavobacterium]OWP81263.1 hypothetical protein BWK63_06570 [Flavobacterium covae]POR22572.1 hypothetical protein BWK57_05785 [Flavobacterium columnare]